MKEGKIFEISQKDFSFFVKELEAEFDVFGPLKTDDQTAVFSKFQFAKLKASSKLETNYAVTALPPTKYLFPPREKILSYEGGKLKETAKKDKKKIILGLNLRDLVAINRLDQYFLGPIRDDLYKNRRDQFLIFAVDNKPPDQEADFDLYFYNQEDRFLVVAKTTRAEKIIAAHHFFKKIKSRMIMGEAEAVGVDLEEIMEEAKTDKIWQELAAKCFGCGICSYVCPLCYCFEVQDHITDVESTDKCSGCRSRHWDSCLNEDFANTSAGNARNDLAARIYHWYYHKFVRSPREYGFTGCVGCERCVVFCPAKINLNEVIAYLRKKYS